MIGALIFVGLIVAVLVLYSHVKELKYQLNQERREKETYEKFYEDFMCAGYYATMPSNYREVPDREGQ